MPSTSAALVGRRYAAVDRRETIVRAHGRSSAAVVGRHVKTFLRLAVSEIPLALNGPLMMTSRRWGSVVMPAPPDPPPANDQSCGRMRSSYGPSVRRTNAADNVY